MIVIILRMYFYIDFNDYDVMPIFNPSDSLIIEDHLDLWNDWFNINKDLSIRMIGLAYYKETLTLVSVKLLLYSFIFYRIHSFLFIKFNNH